MMKAQKFMKEEAERLHANLAELHALAAHQAPGTKQHDFTLRMIKNVEILLNIVE